MMQCMATIVLMICLFSRLIRQDYACSQLCTLDLVRSFCLFFAARLKSTVSITTVRSIEFRAGSINMDAAVWSQLRSDSTVFVVVLSFVPVPDVCRYRSVCREWNALISTPAFATLHAQNSKRLGASFIAMEMQGLETLTWCLLDLNARRWYTFREDRIIAHHLKAFLDLRVAAMDGGLICRFAKAEPPMLSIFVHDLLGHTGKILPPTRRHLTSHINPLVHVVVDSTTHHFTVFLLNRGFDLEKLYTRVMTIEERLKIENDPLLRIYDSSTGQWRSSASNSSWITEHGYFDVVNMVMCQGLLYALTEGREYWSVICYNPAENAWKCTNFYLSKRAEQKPRLITITTRLFVALWRCTSEVPRGGDEYHFEVSEIRIPQMTLETLLKLSMSDLMKLLELDRKGWCSPWYVGVNVNGVGNALFVQSWLCGKAKVFDLDTRSWDHEIPAHPLGHLCSGKGLNQIAKQTNLLLPNSLQYLT